MKNIFFYTACLCVLVLTGCNDEKEKDKETKVTITTTDTAFNKMRSFFAKGFSNFNPDSTLDNIDFYPDLRGKTKYVKFDFEAFKIFIDSLDRVFKDTAVIIYMVYGAYTRQDAIRYIETHVTKPPLEIPEIKDRPTLLVGYKHPKNDYLIYHDFATICPPPRSCSTLFIFHEKKQSFMGNALAGFDPALTISNYNTIYNHPDTRLPELTQSVTFDIKAIKYLVDSMDKAHKITTSEIYFAMGAYTATDADRYVKTHPGTKKEDIIDRTCLLFAYKIPNVEGYKYFDFGTICGTGDNCESGFKW